MSTLEVQALRMAVAEISTAYPTEPPRTNDVLDDETYARAVQAKAALMAFVVSFAPHLASADLARVVELVEVNEPDVAVNQLAWKLESAGFVPDPQQIADFRRLAPEWAAEDDWPARFR